MKSGMALTDTEVCISAKLQQRLPCRFHWHRTSMSACHLWALAKSMLQLFTRLNIVCVCVCVCACVRACMRDTKGNMVVLCAILFMTTLFDYCSGC